MNSTAKPNNIQSSGRSPLTDTAYLRQLLLRLDGKGYRAYREIQGTYAIDGGPMAGALLHIDHVQGDPFAAPSRLRLEVPAQLAGYPPSTYDPKSRRVGLSAYLAREFALAAGPGQERTGSGHSGLIEIDSPDQHMLPRTCMDVDDGVVEARFFAGLPAAGRRVLGQQAAALLCDRVPAIATEALLYQSNQAEAVARYVETAEDADALRDQLPELGLVAFVADGSDLPRRTGIDDRPLREGVVSFESPPSLRVEVELPNRGPVTGMGIPVGITLIVGGGFHGKSTLLDALQVGVYDHIPGDGRQLVVADPTTVVIRSEDGRRIEGVEVTPFIRDLPLGRSTRFFCTENASGSTSQAANIIEALEAGARLLLVDEDTAATNFMIRDGRMQQLVASDCEPITPFLDRVRQLYDEHGVSTVLVMGGSGDYFGVADTVIAMENYLPRDVTAEAHAIAAAHRQSRVVEASGPFGPVPCRVPIPESIGTRRGRREVSAGSRGATTALLGTESIDLSSVEQLVHASQTRAIAAALAYARTQYMDGQRHLGQVLDLVMADIDTHGLDVLSDCRRADHAGFRRFELAAALNRLRTLKVAHP